MGKPSPKAWQAEIEKLKAQIEPLEQRIKTLRSALRGPYVVPVFVLCHGDEEDSWSYTLADAFTALANSDDDYGTYYDAQGVSVGGGLITVEDWHFDPRRPGSEKVLAERDAKLERERARRVEIALALDTTVAVFAGEERVSPAVAFGHGMAHINADYDGNVYGLRLRSENGSVMAVSLHWEQLGPDRWVARWYPEIR